MKKLKRIFFRDPPAVLGTCLVLLLFLFMIIGPFITGYDPYVNNMKETLLPPGKTHWFGTDELGRDIFCRLAYGSWYSMGTALAVVLSSATVGIIIGGISGYAGGWVDNLIMRICDIFMSFPQIFLAMIVAASIGGSIHATIFALSVTWWPSYARMVRGMVISIKERLYVESAVSIGSSPVRILFRCMIPQTFAMIIPQITLGIGNGLIAASGFSFIGLGAQMPMPEWGAMISQASRYVFKAPWYSISSGLCIILSVLGVTLLGDTIQEYTNPEMNKMR